MQGKSMKSFFKSVERQNVPFAIIVGENEFNSKTCNVKDTNTKEQVTLELNDLCNYLYNKLNLSRNDFMFQVAGDKNKYMKYVEEFDKAGSSGTI